MKKVLVVMVLALTLVFGFNLTAPALAQTQTVDEEIVVKKSDLTSDQLAKVKARQMEEKIERLGKYAGMGKEIGVAVREGLTAVKDVSVDFADTKLGKYTMFLIAYKIIGKDLVQLCVGAGLFLIFFPFFIWSYWKRCIPRKILTHKEKGKKDYEAFEPEKEDRNIHWVALAIFIVLFLGVCLC